MKAEAKGASLSAAISEEVLLARLGVEPDEEWPTLDRPGKIRHLANILGISENETSRRIANAAGIPFREDFTVSEDRLTSISTRLLHSLQILPAPPREKSHEAEDCLPVVALWPLSPIEQRWIRTLTGVWPEQEIGTIEKITDRITERYGVGSASLEGQESASFLEEVDPDENDEDAAVIRFVNEVIRQALESRATDIHFEPQRASLTIRYRVDGNLIIVAVPQNLQSFQAAIISRIKIMAHLNISERRRPQDGRIGFHWGRDEIDIRISTLPTLYGESVSLRLLNQKSQSMSVDDIGMRPFEKKIAEKVLHRPNGIILVTGPTGSGKSTSLNAFIRLIQSPNKRIMTVEDPVEYEVPGVNQTQIRDDLGLTFARSLRHILRQDPDIIMIGEIRDRDTADIAIRASLTGHLVLSTLHTNDAPGALTRLIDMEIEPFLIASSVELVIAQRLVRRLCPHCAQKRKEPYEQVLSMRKMLDLTTENFNSEQIHFFHPGGCEWCRGIGYRGRVGVFEFLRVQRAAHDLILERASAKRIRDAAILDGMKPLQESAWDLMIAGTSSPEEVLRHIRTFEEESED